MSFKLSSQSKYCKVRTVSGSRLCRLLLLNAGDEIPPRPLQCVKLLDPREGNY